MSCLVSFGKRHFRLSPSFSGALNSSHSTAGDTERPYDLLSIMHYDADSFSTSNKPTITAKDKAFALYTDDPDEYDTYRMGNRVGLTQLDADQLADLYRDVKLGGSWG